MLPQDYSTQQQAVEKSVRHAQEIVAVTAKATPPVTVSGMYLAGHPLADWLVLMTLIYTTLQVIALCHKLYLQHMRKCDLPHAKENGNDSGKQ